MLDPILLQSFLAVAQTRNFTEAGRRLGLRQSTVSQHVRKLEQEAGRRLFLRDTHHVVPTADGEAMVGFARSILEANDRARRYFTGAQLRGRVRFGTSEDFVSSRLPEILRDLPGAIRGGPGVDGRSQRHAERADRSGGVRSGAGEAPHRRGARTVGVARPAGVDLRPGID